MGLAPVFLFVESDIISPNCSGTGPVRSGSVRIGPVWSGSVRFGPVRSGSVRFGPGNDDVSAQTAIKGVKSFVISNNPGRFPLI